MQTWLRMSGSEPAAESHAVVDTRGPVLAAVCWPAMWVATAGEPSWLAVGAIGGTLALAWGWAQRRWLVSAVGVATLACLVIGGVHAWQQRTDPLRVLADEGAIVTIDGSLVGVGRLTPVRHGSAMWVTRVRVSQLQGRGSAWVSGGLVTVVVSGGHVEAWRSLAPGSTIRAVVRLAAPDRLESAVALARAREPPQVLSPPSPLDSGVERIHQGLRDSVSGLPDEPRALVPALVVGDTSAMTEELQERFQITGLTHLTAVSGANLTLLLGAILWLAGLLGARGWWLRLAALVGVVAFVLLCRGEPSVLRAAAMGTVGLAALGWGGRRQGLGYLSWAVIGLLLVDPWLSRSLGFALSASATAGIVLFAGTWTRGLSAWLPRWAAEALAVPLAAQVATQPLVTAVSGQISVVGILANLVAGPLVGPATVFGFAAAACAPLAPWAATVLGWLAGACAQGLCWLSSLAAVLPGAAVAWPVHPLAIALLGAACLTAPVLLPVLWRRRWAVIGLALGLVVALVRPPIQPGWPPADWEVTFCDVGQGDATVVRVSEGTAVVIDTGPDPRALSACLSGLGVDRVPLVILTHLHADHIGGLAGIFDGREVGRLLVSGVREPAYGWASVVALTGSLPAAFTAGAGTVVSVGRVRLEVLAIKPFAASVTVGEGESTEENDSSLVLRVSTPALSVVVAGDVEEAGQLHALGQAQPGLHADVLLVPHHGSGRQSPEFLAATGARVAVVSVGADNDYGHPAGRTLRLVESSGARVFRTDLHGSIGIGRAGQELAVTTQRSS